jgi:hypothetical protein
VNYKHKH